MADASAGAGSLALDVLKKIAPPAVELFEAHESTRR